MSKAFKKQRRQ